MGERMEYFDVVVVGAGPVGLTAAIDLGRRGVKTLIVDTKVGPCQESRAIVIDHAALQHFAELGCVSEMMKKGLKAKSRKTFLGTTELFRNVFDHTKFKDGLPMFLNLPQFQTEAILASVAACNRNVSVRWETELTEFTQTEDSVGFVLEDEMGSYNGHCKYVVACDGCRSPIRKRLGIDFPGYTCPSPFLIVDVEVESDMEKEHSFYFNHPTNPELTLLTVPQPQNVWRMDWQLPANTETEHVTEKDALRKRVRSVIGDQKFVIVEHSVYKFHQRLVPQMSKGRVFLAGDSAHLVNPFGARGMNSGIQDVRNLCWRLQHAIFKSDTEILNGYNHERMMENLEHQRVTKEAMKFIAPPDEKSSRERNRILAESRTSLESRSRIKSGRMSDIPIRPAPLLATK